MLVGRDAELAEAVAAVAAAPSVVVIEGEAGIGKTRLVAELRRHPELTQRRFLSGGSRRIREPFPLGPVLEAVRGLGEAVPAGLSPLAGALRPLLPELTERLPPGLPSLGDRLAEQHRVFRALVEVFGAIGPAVLVLEDLHWADGQTVDFLEYLVGEPPEQLAVVLTYREEEVAPAVRALPSRLPAHVACSRVTMTPLDAAQTGELAAAILGAERISEEFAGYLCERASGLPFAIEELLALLRARGSLVPRGGRWARRALDELAVPARIRDSVRERASRLSVDGRAVLAAAAVFQLPVAVPVLVDIGELGEAPARAGLTEALQSGLLSWQGTQVGFRHVLAMQAVYDDLPPLERQERHARAASAVAAFEPVPLGQLAYHLRQAGRIEEWVRAAERAAIQAAELGDHEQAVRLLGEVLQQATLSVLDRARLTVQLGWSAGTAVRHLDVPLADLVTAALEPAPDLPADLRGQLHLLHGYYLERIGDLAASHREMAAAAEYLDDRSDLLALAVLALTQPLPAFAVAAGEHAWWLERAVQLIPPSDESSLHLLGGAADLLLSVGDPRARAYVERIRSRAGNGAGPGAPAAASGVVRAFAATAVSACYVGDYPAAEELLQQAVRRVDPDTSPRHLAMIRTVEILLGFGRGAWGDIADHSVQLRRELGTDYVILRCHVDVVTACLALANGEVDAAETSLREMVAAGDQPWAGAAPLDVLPLPLTAYLRLALVRDDAATALPAVTRAVAAWEAYPMLPPAVRVLPWAVAALVATDRTAQAAGLVRRWADLLRGLEAPLAPAAFRHARAVLAAASGRLREAGALAEDAAGRYRELWCPYEMAQATEQAARWWLCAGDERGGRAAVAALAGYQELGASWDAGRVASLARRHRVPVPARHGGGRRSYGAELSPREREVAELAATGRTNREIARELYLSAKTVDKHISAALRKLHLPSRAALTHHLASGSAPAGTNHGESSP